MIMADMMALEDQRRNTPMYNPMSNLREPYNPMINMPQQTAQQPSVNGLTPEQQKQILWQSLMSAGQGMLGASAPSLNPQSRSLAYGLSQGLGGFAQGTQQGMANIMQQQQMADMAKKRQQAIQEQQIRQSIASQIGIPASGIASDMKGGTIMADGSVVPKGYTMLGERMVPQGIADVIKGAILSNEMPLANVISLMTTDKKDLMTLHQGDIALDPSTGTTVVTNPKENKPPVLPYKIGERQKFTNKDGKTYEGTFKGLDANNNPQFTDVVKVAEKSATTMGLSAEAVKALSERFTMTGDIPGMGMGKAATEARASILNKWASDLKNTGTTPEDQVIRQTAFKASKVELNKLQSQRGTVMAFANTATKNLDLVSNLSEKVDRTGAPIINKWLLAGKRSVLGDADVSQFDAAVRTAITEYAKVTSSATGGGVTSDTARKEVEGMLNTAQNKEQVMKVITLLKQEMNNRKSGYDEQINFIKENMANAGKLQKTGQSQDIIHQNLPSASQYKNKYLTDTETGKKYQSNGTNWIEVK